MDIIARAEQGNIKINVPIDIRFTEINKLLEAKLSGMTFPENQSGPVVITVQRATLAASGDRLLISLGEAKIIEEKTSNPASYAVLGVEDAGLASAGGIEVALLGASKPVTLIVGHPAGNGSYVRRGGDAQTYAVEPAIALEGDAKDWIDTRLLDLPFEKIQSIRMQLSDGSHYVISRLPPPPAAAGKDKAATPPEGFRLAAVPAGREANEPGLIAPSPTSFDGVPAEDVAPVAGIDFSKPSIAEISLTGGATLTITGTAAADKHWIQLKSSDDAALNAKTQGRAFEVASYRYEAIFRPLEQLLKPKPVKAASGHLPGTPAHSPAANRKLPNGTP